MVIGKRFSWRRKNGPVKGPFQFQHSGSWFRRDLQIIQRPIHRQLPQHDQLRNPQQHMPMRAVHQPGESVAMVLAEVRVSQASASSSSLSMPGAMR